jgi:hypothetical protein
VLLAEDENSLELDVTREASFQFDSAPDDPVAAATVFQSLWQMNLVGLKVVRHINWQLANPDAVRVITAAAYI